MKNLKSKSLAFQSGLQKVEQYIIQNDLSLSVLFNVIDTNADQSLNKSEFKQKLRGLHVGLLEEEFEALFQELDKKQTGQVSYDEFLRLFSKINAAQLIQRMRKVLYGARMSIETLYNKHCDNAYMT